MVQTECCDVADLRNFEKRQILRDMNLTEKRRRTSHFFVPIFAVGFICWLEGEAGPEAEPAAVGVRGRTVI